MHFLHHPTTTLTLTILATILNTTPTRAHGFVTSPSSRQNSCFLGTATNPGLCAAVAQSPELISGPAGFPSPGGPPDALLCSGGNGAYFGVNVGYPGLWPLTVVPHDQNLTIEWNITASAPTAKFEYFVTKPGLIEYKPLMRDDFEHVPMFTLTMDGKVPGASFNHSIPRDRIPAWLGRGVIYAVWTPEGSDEAFYSCLDVTFGEEGVGASGFVVQDDL